MRQLWYSMVAVPAKGVILITTKRGKDSPMHIDVRANVGVNVPKAYPKYLDADCYMTMYKKLVVMTV